MPKKKKSRKRRTKKSSGEHRQNTPKKKILSQAQRESRINSANGYLSSNYDKAIELYNEAILLGKDDFLNAQGFCFRGYAYAQKGDYEQAIADCDQAIQFNGTYARAYFNRGYAYLFRGSNYSRPTDYDQAIADYEQAITNSSGEEDLLVPIAHCFKGIAYSYKGSYSNALKSCDQGIKMGTRKSKSFLLYCMRGYIHYYNEQFESAIEDHVTAIKVDPQNAIPHNNLGAIYINQKEYDQALSCLKEATKYNDDPLYHINIGVAHRELCRYDRALESFKRAIEKSNDARAYLNEGLTYKRMGETEQAIESYDNALRLCDNYRADCLCDQDFQLIHGKDALESAKELLETVISSRPDQNGDYYKGLLALLFEREDTAQVWFEKALEHGDHNKNKIKRHLDNIKKRQKPSVRW